MKKGEFTVSDIMILLIFVVVLLAFFAVVDWERKEVPPVKTVSKPTGGFMLQSYLRSPVRADINLDGNKDAETVADLIVLAYSDETARAELEKEVVGTAAFIRRNGGDMEVRVVYPDGTTIESDLFMDVGNEHPALRGRVAFLPLGDGKTAKVYYDNIKEAGGTGINNYIGGLSPV